MSTFCLLSCEEFIIMFAELTWEAYMIYSFKKYVRWMLGQYLRKQIYYLRCNLRWDSWNRTLGFRHRPEISLSNRQRSKLSIILTPPEGLSSGPCPRLCTDCVCIRHRPPSRNFPDRRPLLADVAQSTPVGQHSERPLILLRLEVNPVEVIAFNRKKQDTVVNRRYFVLILCLLVLS